MAMLVLITRTTGTWLIPANLATFPDKSLRKLCASSCLRRLSRCRPGLFMPVFHLGLGFLATLRIDGRNIFFRLDLDTCQYPNHFVLDAPQ